MWWSLVRASSIHGDPAPSKAQESLEMQEQWCCISASEACTQRYATAAMDGSPILVPRFQIVFTFLLHLKVAMHVVSLK